MMLGGPYGSTDTAGVRAGATKRWLEISGPTYQEQTVIIHSMLPSGATIQPLGEACIFRNFRQMSNASWYMCAQALRGDVLNLKLRTDPVAVLCDG